MVWILPAETDDDALAPSDEADLPDPRKHRAVRERNDGGKRDPFILNRFEKILAMAEMAARRTRPCARAFRLRGPSQHSDFHLAAALLCTHRSRQVFRRTDGVEGRSVLLG